MALTTKYIPVLAGLLLLVSGCTLHRPVSIDAGPLPAGFAESGAGVAAAGRIGRWWEIFQDEILNGLVDEGLRHSPELTQAHARLAQLEAVALGTAGGEQPSLKLEGQAGRDSRPVQAGTEQSTTFRLSMTAGFELDLWQRLQKRTAAAYLDVSASREDIRTLYLGLTARIVELYYLAVEQRQQMLLTDRVIESSEEIGRLVEDRYREGQALAREVYQARQELAAARARRPVIEASLALTEHALAILLGRFPRAGGAGSLAVLPPVPEAFPQGLPADLLTRRPDIAAAGLRIKAKDDRLAAALADRFPTLNLLGSYGRSRIDLTSIISGGFWNLGASLTESIFDGGRRRAEVDRNRALLDEELARYRQVVLQAFREVEDALSDNRTTEERLELLRVQGQAVAANARLAMDNYLQGIDGYLPVLAADLLTLENTRQVLAVERQLISDRISLIRALGGDWPDAMPDRPITNQETRE